MRNLPGTICALAAVGCGGVSAQSLDYAALEQLFGEPVTTSVTGSPQRESEVAATMRIITADDIRRSGARDIPGILRHVGGVDVLQTSNDHAEVGVRGYNQVLSQRLLVLVDGRQVYADYYELTPWSAVPVELEAIRQIEIVKGPSSALFGFNAVGGVINIVTYDPLHAAVSAVSVVAGTQGLAQGSAVSTWKFGDSAGLRISAGHRANDDFSTPLRPVDAGARRGNERNAINLDVDLDVGDNLLFGLEATYSDVQQAEFSPTYSLTSDRYETSSLKGSVAAETRLGLIQATVYTNKITADIFLGNSPDAFLIFDNQITVAQLQSISKIASKHTLRVSAEYRENTMATTPFPGADVFYDIAAIGGMWEWQVSSSVTLTTAIRSDYWSLGRSGLLPAGYGLTNDDWDLSRTEPSLNTGVVWQVGEVDTLRFMVGRGVQMPNLLNLGGIVLPVPPVGFYSGVPDLKPTIVDNYELGWDRTLPRLAAKLGVSVFHGRSRDIVATRGGARLVAGAFLFSPANIDHSQTTGLEASIDATLREHWRWGASYSRQTIDDDFAAAFPFALMFVDFERTTPRHVLDANIGWSRGPWEVDGYLRYQSKFNGIADGVSGAMLVPISSYVSVDGRVGYAVNDRMMLALSGQNLTQAQQHQTAALDVERRLLGTFSISF